jgi:hypothetical protein
VSRPGARAWQAVVLAASLAGPAAAGVPLYLDADGIPARHLVPVVSNATVSAADPSVGPELADLVARAGAVWAEVPTAQIAFGAGALVGQPIDVSSYAQFLGVCGDGLSPLIADPDGSIVDDLFGTGAAEVLLGVGLADCDPSDGFIDEHTMLVNFSALPPPSPERDALALRIVTHELGHVIGLAHSLLNFEFQDDGNAANDVYLPMMYPVLSDDDPLGAAHLHLDDASILSLLYPAAGFVTSTATVAGLTLLPPASRPVSGTFLAIRSTSDPLATAEFTASGLTPTGVVLGGVFAALDQPGEPRGAFQASGLPPGEYTVEVLGGVNGERPEFFSGVNESHDVLVDPPEAATPLTLGAGETATDVDLLLDGDPRTAGAKASDTSWRVTWRGRAKVPGDSAKVPPEALPPPGRLDLLGTGALVLRSGSTLFDTLFSGHWTPAVRRRGVSKRRYDHTLGMPDTLLAFGELLFGNAATFSEVSASGSAKRRKVKGSVVLRGLYFTGARSLKLTLTFKYRGGRLTVDQQPGPVPPIAPVAVVVAPTLAQVGHGGQVTFAASVEGALAGVTWELRGPGTIDASGLYTAPGSGTARAQVIARSTSVPGAIGLAAVDVGP